MLRILAVVCCGFFPLAGCAGRPLDLPEAAPDLRPSTADLAAPIDLAVQRDAGIIDLSVDAALAPDLAEARPPRLLSPLSTAIVRSRRPTLRWEGGSGTLSVDLCGDRACSKRLGSATLGADGESARPDFELPTGAVFWRVRAGASASPVWELFVPAGAGAHDTSWGSVPDPDGDGRPDLVVGQLGAEMSNGGTFVYGGPLRSPSPSPSPSVVIAGDGAPCCNADMIWSAWTVASAGDLDGDGFAELVVSEIDVSPTGPGPAVRVHIYSGGPGGVDASRRVDLAPPNASLQYGRVAIGVGDVDGDGYGDLLVTAIADPGGTAYLYRGGPNGPSAPLTVATAGGDNDYFAISAAACDVDGDGHNEILLNSGTPSSGGVHILSWNGSGFVQTGSITGTGDEQLGVEALAVGDVDGDGRCDLLLGSSGASGTENVVQLYLGTSSGLPTAPDRTFTGDLGTGNVQSFLATQAVVVGDIDGDGSDDFVLSGRTSTGGYAARLVFGGSFASFDLTGDEDLVSAGVGDLDGDGAFDVALGMPESNSVRVLSGAALAKRQIAPLALLSQVSGAAMFGYSLAGL